jgi:hypothetical protein
MGILFEDEELKRMSEEMLDRGMIVETAWLGFSKFMLPANTSEEQLKVLRLTFFCGAKCLFDSLQYTTDVEDRMAKLEAELAQWDMFMREKESGGKQ